LDRSVTSEPLGALEARRTRTADGARQTARGERLAANYIG
jgi:hypothetical protein